MYEASASTSGADHRLVRTPIRSSCRRRAPGCPARQRSTADHACFRYPWRYPKAFAGLCRRAIMDGSGDPHFRALAERVPHALLAGLVVERHGLDFMDADNAGLPTAST